MSNQVKNPAFGLTREEIVELNKNIPAERFLRAKNPEKTPVPSPIEQYETTIQRSLENDFNPFLAMVQNVTAGVDLDKYGIDKETMMFKPGWGPNGYTAPKLTFWQKVKRFFGR